MANVKKYIDQQNGDIRVESSVGSGTKFIVEIPMIKNALSVQEKIDLQKDITHFNKCILLVEDEQAIADVQYRILTHAPCNHRVDIANNGQVAIDLFDRNDYDFVSLDYILPGNIGGMDVYDHIRKSDNTIPILFVSGNLEFIESIKELKHKDPCIAHQSKPCKNLDYINATNRLMSKVGRCKLAFGWDYLDTDKEYLNLKNQ